MTKKHTLSHISNQITHTKIKYNFTHHINKNQKISSAAKNAEKMQPSYLAGASVNCTTIPKNTPALFN